VDVLPLDKFTLVLLSCMSARILPVYAFLRWRTTCERIRKRFCLFCDSSSDVKVMNLRAGGFASLVGGVSDGTNDHLMIPAHGLAYMLPGPMLSGYHYKAS
jgi:hypothetical protein